jgi:hypothetical protein
VLHDSILLFAFTLGLTIGASQWRFGCRSQGWPSPPSNPTGLASHNTAWLTSTQAWNRYVDGHIHKTTKTHVPLKHHAQVSRYSQDDDDHCSAALQAECWPPAGEINTHACCYYMHVAAEHCQIQTSMPLHGVSYRSTSSTTHEHHMTIQTTSYCTCAKSLGKWYQHRYCSMCINSSSNLPG